MAFFKKEEKSCGISLIYCRLRKLKLPVVVYVVKVTLDKFFKVTKKLPGKLHSMLTQSLTKRSEY